MKRLQPRKIPTLARLAATAAIAGGLVAPPVATAQTDPMTDPVPAPEYVDDKQSFVLQIDFTSENAGTGASVAVANVVTPGTEHLKAEVIVRTELEGQQRGSFTIEHPAMSFAHGAGYFFQPGRYDLLVPFDSLAETIRLIAVVGGGDIAVIDTAPAIRQFCVANPSDPSCLEADLSVDNLQATAPLFAVVGKPVQITATSTVSNGGPDTPVDAVVTRAGVVAAGLSVTPTAARVTTTSLAAGTPATYSDAYTVTCTAPGTHALDLTTSITPKRARVVDANSANDSRTTRLLFDCAIPVTINIQPGSLINPVNLTGSTLPVAALTTSAGEYGNPIAFDATGIEASTLRFGSAAALQASRGVPELHTAIHPERSLELDEKTKDGDLDALMHFRPRRESLDVTDTEGCVYGRLTAGAGGFSFFGCDKASPKL